MSIAPPHGPRRLAIASGLLLALVVAAAVAVGVDAVSDPNGIQFGAPWPLLSELVAVAVAACLALGVQAQQRRMRPGLFAFDVGAALVGLLMLGAVAFVLSFNQL
jgi:NO-binding membrane sensor protein with MHYT domain